MVRAMLLFICCFGLLSVSAQTFKVSGKITNNKLEPLAFVNVQIKGWKTGTLTKEDGMFELQLYEGSYDILVSMIGYKPQVISLIVKGNYTQNIILETEVSDISGVTVSSKAKDHAEEIIRNTIHHKEAIAQAHGPYTCNVYIKATQEDSLAIRPNRKPKKLDSAIAANPNADLNGMAMAEIFLKLDYASAQHVKEERLGVKKRGNPESLFYLRTTDGTFDVYNNLIKMPVISETDFLSPISYSGLLAYRFKTVKVQTVDGRKLYTISVKPRQLSNATMEGELVIEDSTWAVRHTRFSLPAYHLPEYDFFEIEQQYTWIANKAWMVTRQTFTYYSKSKKKKSSGRTIAVFKDFELDKQFDKKYFGNEVSTTTEKAYRQDSTFWQQKRTEPLSQKEVRFIHYNDSIYRATHSKAYLDSIDAKINKFTLMKALVLGQTFNDHEKERTWSIPSVIGLWQPLQLGGSRINPSVYYSQRFPSRKNISLFANVSYGFRNRDVNGSVNLTRMYNPFNRGAYSIHVGREFQYIFQGDAWINMLKRSNIYLNNSLGIGHNLELLNGLVLFTDAEIALRRSVSNYKTNDLVDSLFGSILTDNQAIAFEPYNAVYGKIRLQYTPGQHYIREPKEKIIIGSKWPTFYTTWRKGIPGILQSKVDFDYWELGMEQELKLGTAGITKYNIKSGSFLSQKDLRLIDYQFQRRGDPILFQNPEESFQALDSSFPLFKRFYQAHLVHQFNGALINKIPLLKKLQLREVAGAGFLYAPERNLKYAETFVGLERVFKWPFNPLYKFKIGLFVVGSTANKFSNPIQFKIGLASWDKVLNKWQ